MNDTPSDVRAQFLALLMARPEGERALMAFGMFDFARAVVVADIRQRHPGIGDADLRVKIFERTYGSDFNERDREIIARAIRKS